VNHRLNFDREFARGVPEEMLQNIRNKISYYEAAVEALRNPVVRCKNCKHYNLYRLACTNPGKLNGWIGIDGFYSYGERKDGDSDA
jgi:hypothetical protein